MPQSNQEYTARRVQPTRYNANYDCELPEDARRELGKPKRAAILRRPPVIEHSGIWKWVVGFAICVVILAGAIGHYTQQQKHAPAAAPVQPAPARVVTPPPVGIAPTPAPRAQLVRLPLPPPRAQLVRLPAPDDAEIAPQNIGRTHTMAMPYGTVVSATLRGFLGNENQLPRAGHIGDMYVVEQTPWIWIQVPGTTAPTWVDP
jgi:hypothetical protein